MTTDCYISVRDMQYSYYCDGFKIVATTDIPCHLYMRWSTTTPQKHIVPKFMRGIFMHEDIYLCFVAYTDNEQEEAGDTLTHTFVKRTWPICETRWFYFWGKVAGQTCVSTSAIFELHFDIQTHPYAGEDSNRTIRQTNVNWDICHDAASGTIHPWYGPPFYHLFAGSHQVASYFIDRAFLAFNTPAIPGHPTPAAGFLSLYPSIIWADWLPYPNLYITRGVQSDPIVPTNYGDQLPYTIVGGQKSLFDFIANQYNNIELNDLGLLMVTSGGITKLCLRSQIDIEDINILPMYNSFLRFYSSQKGPGFRPILTLCYPP